MALVNFLPLALALCCCLPVALARVSSGVDRVLSRLALGLFGGYVTDARRPRERRKRTLQSAHVGVTYRLYASRTLLYAALFALVGSVLGVYLVGAAFVILAIPPADVRAALPDRLDFVANAMVIPELSIVELFGLLVASSATVGVLAGAGAYHLRWYLPRYAADARARRIDESLPRTVAFVYALSRSGMAFPEILRTLARNQSVYGEAAKEIEVTVKRMDLVGMDLLSAIRSTAQRTPSETFREFAENLASVLQSGRSVSAFADDQHERFQEEARGHQEQFLQQLATLAEGYVSLLVIGPLLLITILVVMGLMGLVDTLRVLWLMTYLVVPLATAAFVIYLDSITESLRVSREERAAFETPLTDVRRAEDADAVRDGVDGRVEVAQSDGGTATGDSVANAERLAAYERFRSVRRRFADPFRTVRERPTTLLLVTVPLALAWTLWRAFVLLDNGSLTVRAFDDVLVLAAVFLLGTFALVQEGHRRRIDAIESAVPDLLDRLANVNDAGMSVVESLGRVTRSDLGALDAEMDRTWADVQWGTDAETALRRFERRVRTPTVTRVVALVTNAMSSSGDLARVLRIAANDAQATRRLKRERKQEMFTYLVIIYLSFLVFLVIVVALTNILIPNLPTGEAISPGNADVVGTGIGSSILSGVETEAYTLVLYHTALVQAVCSGLVAGQMGEGDVKNGAKHATAMVIIAVGLFVVL